MISRRRFLKWGLGGAALATSATVLGVGFWGYTVERRIAERLRFLSEKEYCVLRAAAGRIVGVGAADGADSGSAEIDVARFVDGVLRHFDAATRREVRGLLHLLEHSPLALGAGARWSRFSSAPAAAQDALLAAWQSSNLTVLRQGFQGLRSLVFMGYYRDPRTFAMLGYDGPTVQRPAGQP